MNAKVDERQKRLDRLKEELGEKLNTVVDKFAAEEGLTREEVIQSVVRFQRAVARKRLAHKK
jgi:hypothetical protein